MRCLLLIGLLAAGGCSQPLAKVYIVGGANAKVGFVRIQNDIGGDKTFRRVFLWDGERWNEISVTVEENP